MALKGLQVGVPDYLQDSTKVFHGHEDIGILLFVLRGLNQSFFDVFRHFQDLLQQGDVDSRLCEMLLDVVFKDLFIVGVPVLEEVNHHDDGLKDELSQLPIFVGGH